MHLDHRIPIGLGHGEHHAIAENAGVVDQDVERAERIDRLVDHALGAGEVADVVAVDDGVASHSGDLCGNVLRGRRIRSGAVGFAAEIVDDHLRAMTCEHERVFTPNAATRTGHDRDTTLT